jgi:preprotein translocase subunit SecG
MDLMLLKVHFVMHVLAAIWVICAMVLILIILIQKGRGGGLSGAFGGGGAGGILGTKTGDFLTWVTVTLVGVFLLLSVVLARFYRPIAAKAENAPVGQAQPVAPLPADNQEIPESAEADIDAEIDNEVQIPGAQE